MAHNFHVYGRFLNILRIDLTFIKTKIKESGKYGGKNRYERDLKNKSKIFMKLFEYYKLNKNGMF